MTEARWHRLMQSLGFPPNDDAFRALRAAYSEPHRHYHTAAHISACLALLDECAGLAAHPAEIELALWFHDAVYQPLSASNERDSAEWAERFLAANGATAELSARVRRLILATAHDAEPETDDEALLLDLDLAILGVEPAGYAAYEAAIRREYRSVPMPIYRSKRTGRLRGFLARPHLYRTAHFRQAREQQARANLAHAIAQLGKGGMLRRALAWLLALFKYAAGVLLWLVLFGALAIFARIDVWSYVDGLWMHELHDGLVRNAIGAIAYRAEGGYGDYGHGAKYIYSVEYQPPGAAAEIRSLTSLVDAASWREEGAEGVTVTYVDAKHRYTLRTVSDGASITVVDR